MKLFATCFLSLCAAGALSATSVTPLVTATVVNANAVKLADANGDLVGPYTLKVNGVSYSALCIDHEDDAVLGQSYSAYQTQVGSSNLSNTYHSTFGTQYKEEAYLLSLILQPNADRINIQDAAWGLTDSSYKVSASAQKYMTLAANNYSTFDFSNYMIISGSSSTQCSRAQEFMIKLSPATAATPEPASLFLISAGMIVAGLLKRRKASTKA